MPSLLTLPACWVSRSHWPNCSSLLNDSLTTECLALTVPSLGRLNLVEVTASLYLLNGFVHFRSSLDVSELAKAAKKKLQSVSISSW